MREHTPTPWKCDGRFLVDDRSIPVIIARVFGEDKDRAANAAYIVQAVNSHEALVEALRKIAELMDGPRSGESYTRGQVEGICEAALDKVQP